MRLDHSLAIKLVSFLALALVLCACATAQRISSQPYEGADLGRYAFSFWNVVSVNSSVLAKPMQALIRDDDLHFVQGCSHANYGYDTRARKLTVFKHYMSGGCAGPKLIATLDDALKRVAIMRFGGGRLDLQDENSNSLMVLDRILPKGVEYVTWRIAKYSDGNALIRPRHQEDVVPELSFWAVGIDGTANCAGWVSGTYLLTGDTITTSDIFPMGTVIAGVPCPRVIYDEVGAIFYGNLEGTRTIRKIGDMIRLRDEKGVDRLELVPRANW